MTSWQTCLTTLHRDGGDLEFSKLTLESTYFGYYTDNKDDLGVNYLQYFFLNPKYFRRSAKVKGEYGVLSVLEPYIADKIISFT